VEKHKSPVGREAAIFPAIHPHTMPANRAAATTARITTETRQPVCWGQRGARQTQLGIIQCLEGVEGNGSGGGGGAREVSAHTAITRVLELALPFPIAMC
jgi:hypothetical protein